MVAPVRWSKEVPAVSLGGGKCALGTAAVPEEALAMEGKLRHRAATPAGPSHPFP